MPVDNGQVSTLRREPGATPAAQPDGLKLIDVGVSADGRRVDLHFLTMTNRVTSVQLDVTVATGLYNLLGATIGRIKAGLPPSSPTRLN